MKPAGNSEPKRREGKVLNDLVTDEERSPKEGRVGEIIEVSSIDEPVDVPKSISAGEVEPSVADYSHINLDAVPLRGLKYFSVAILLVLLIYVGVEVRTTFVQALEIHWVLAAIFGGIISMAIGFGAYLLWQLLGSNGDDVQIAEIRSLADDISLQHSCGTATELFAKLDSLYQNKPQNVHWKRCKESISDYNDDREALAHIDLLFLSKLDEEAQVRISRHSTQIGVSVAISPWVSVDMILSFWRNLKMIVDVAQVYGVRPSLRNRLRLLRRVLNHMAVSGVSELAINELLQDVGGQGMLNAFSARLAQGMGVGIYSAKIGIAVMCVCRPISFEKDSDPSLRDIAVQLKKEIFKVKTS